MLEFHKNKNNMQVWLSHYSLNMLHNSSHQWACKMMGIESDNNIYFEGGHQGERIIQEHVSGVNVIPELSHIKHTFEIVETEKFDEKTKFVKNIHDKGDLFILQGFADGLTANKKGLLEIKLSSAPWSVTKFKNHMQRKLYAWGFPTVEKSTIITGPILSALDMREAKASGAWENWSTDEWRERIISNWKVSPPVVHECDMTENDAREAEKWFWDGVEILRKGDFTGGLDEDGLCRNPMCAFGSKCYFKAQQQELIS